MSVGQHVALLALIVVLALMDIFGSTYDCSIHDAPFYRRNCVRESETENDTMVNPYRDAGDRVVPHQQALDSNEGLRNLSAQRILRAKSNLNEGHPLQIVVQTKVADPLDIGPDLEAICSACCTSDKLRNSTSTAWIVMATVASVMNRLSAPYALHSGALLGLVRDCDLLQEGDLSIALERQWFIHNLNKVRFALKFAGMKMVDIYESVSEWGYEETWSKDEVQIRIMPFDVVRHGYTWAHWTREGTPNHCFTPALSFAQYTWKDVKVRIPLPVEPALQATYGSNYMKEESWVLGKHLLEHGCNTSEYVDWQSSVSTLKSNDTGLQSSVPTGRSEVERFFKAEADRESTDHLEIARQPKVHDRLDLVWDQSYVCPGCCPSDNLSSANPKSWSVMATLVSILNRLRAPYVLTSGALLGLVRNCDLLDENDLDFAIDREWIMNNVQGFKEALANAGFKMHRDYGKIGERGYEMEYWINKTIKIDFFFYDATVNGYSYALWTGKGKTHNVCFTPAWGFQGYNWKGVELRIPVPVELALEAFYGPNYTSKQPWTWNKHPFEHNCKQKDALEKFDWQWTTTQKRKLPPRYRRRDYSVSR